MFHKCFRPGRQFQTAIAIEPYVWGVGIEIVNFASPWELVKACLTLQLLCLSIKTWFSIRHPYWWPIIEKEL